MYFQKLSSAETFSGIPTTTLNALDIYLASLSKESAKVISASGVSNSLGIKFEVALDLLERCEKIKLLEEQICIVCPVCESSLKLIPISEAFEELSQESYCAYCESEHLEITSENVYSLYKLLDKPSIVTEAEVKKKTIPITKCSLDIISNTGMEKVFFAPTEAEYAHLRDLYEACMVSSFSNTTEQGNTLNNLCNKLLNLVKVFDSVTTIRKPERGNQIDCAVHNTLCICPSIFNEIGTFFYCECKHEKEKPDNTYYLKLIGILLIDGLKFGIVFSRLPCTSTCHKIARDNFLSHRVILINITIDELKNVIYDKINFLKLIEKKIFTVHTDCDGKDLFR